MLGISKKTITEKVKDVIYETGLFSPRSGITIYHRFKEDYGLEGAGAIAAFTSRVNGRFKPYGATISTTEMAGCARVSNLISLLFKKANKLVRKVPARFEGLLVRRRLARIEAKKLARKRRPS
ncbi:hypothetical protein [Pseudorhodoplanes sp.]|uniref:hypothetical protein n=1 Tax=Pseudorhodoplanes sp. TaxID=1934341 RepID=UPI003D1054D7